MAAMPLKGEHGRTPESVRLGGVGGGELRDSVVVQGRAARLRGAYLLTHSLTNVYTAGGAG